MKDYITLEDKELLGILDDAHDWACDEVGPCFRVLCGRYGIDYDKLDFNIIDHDWLFDLLCKKVGGIA